MRKILLMLLILSFFIIYGLFSNYNVGMEGINHSKEFIRDRYLRLQVTNGHRIENKISGNKKKSVNGTWKTETIEGNITKGGRNDVAIDNKGDLHIVYYSNSTLKYAKRTNKTWKIELLNKKAGRGIDCSITLSKMNNPNLSFSSEDFNLKYAKKVSGKWIIETVDDRSAFYNSIVLKKGNPFIEYHENIGLKRAVKTNGKWQIKHSYCDCEENTGLDIFITKDNKERIHRIYRSSMYNPDGKDYKSLHYDVNGGMLSQDNAYDNVIESGKGRDFVEVSMAIDIYCRPHIVYIDRNKNLVYLRKPGKEWRKSNIFRNIVTGYCSLISDSRGDLHLCYFNGDKSKLYYAKYDRKKWRREVVATVFIDKSKLKRDLQFVESGYNSIVVDKQNNPHIIFYDRNTKSLKHAYK